MADNAAWAKRWSKVLVGNYAPQPVTLVRGEGCELFDAEGVRYLDLMGGIATAALGHAHPRVLAALEAQARRVWHVSNLYGMEPCVELAEKLVANSFADRVFFCNSGGEANEAALKLARRYHHDRGDGRYEFVAFEGGFHGRTLFTVSATGTRAYWEGFGPMVEGFHHVPFGDLAAVEAKLCHKTAAIIVEPVQGESGVRPAPPGFLAGLRKLADANGCLLIFDEVQCGMGRTGTLWAHESAGVTPDVMTSAKALGNGIPIGATLVTEACASALVPGTHGSTFGGNPLAAACANAVLDELLDGGVLEHAREMGLYLGEALGAMARRLDDKVVETRGAGLLRAIELPEPVAGAVAAIRDRGVLVIAAGANNLRLAPPLIITREQLDEGLAVIEEVLRS